MSNPSLSPAPSSAPSSAPPSVTGAAQAGPSGERVWVVKLLLWLCGGWLFLTVAMAFTASANFRALDPETMRNAAAVYAEIDPAERRQDLRYAASEINRYLFTVYSDLHLAVAGLAFVLVLGARLTRWRRLLVITALGVCLVFALIFALWFTPTMVELGRVIDFMPRDPAPPEVTRFFALHGINVAMEMTKMLLLLVASVALMRR